MLKTVSSIVNAIGALNYKGTWNASTNTPTLASGVGTKGDYYVVSVAGTTNLDGTDYWGVGDWAVFNGSIWQRVEGGSETDTDSVNFNIAANVTPTIGELTWSNEDNTKTLALGLANGDIQYIGEEQYFRIKASSGITKGQVVMFTGTLGASGGLTGAPATGLQPEQSNYILGVSKDTLSTNDWGYVQYFGEVKGINTTGGAENWVQGDVLYFNPLVAGGLTKTKPTAPAAIAVVAAVVHVSASSGILFVRPTYGTVLGGTDGNVNFSNLAANNYITYNGTVWVNQPPANVVVGTGLTGGGLTNANGIVNIAISNTTVTAGVYGNASTVPQVTFNAQGQATNATNVAIAISVTNVANAVPDSREIIAGTGLTGGGNLSSNVTISMGNTNVSPATYGDSSNVAQFTVDAQGRITSATNVAITSAGTVTNVATGTGLTGGPITTTGTIFIANTGVTAATYGNATSVAQVQVNAQGQITNATNVAIAISTSNVSGLGTMATQNANAVAITGGSATGLTNLSAANVVITSTLAANLSSSSTAAMPDPSLPLNPEGYITVTINGVAKKIPYYGV